MSRIRSGVRRNCFKFSVLCQEITLIKSTKWRCRNCHVDRCVISTTQCHIGIVISDMDVLHTQLYAIQQKMSFVATESIHWKLYVQTISWVVTLFESYLMYVLSLYSRPSVDVLTLPAHSIRQYPLYYKPSPPPFLASHFSDGEFTKSQNYGRDKAKFAFVSGLYQQLVVSLMLQYGSYAWAWRVSGLLLAKAGYGSEYQASDS